MIPNGGPFSLVVANSWFSNNGSGILIKPDNSAAVVKLDHVKIAGNAGGGLKTDSSSGQIMVDITDSIFTGNAGNGINAVSNGGGPNVINISRTVIADNGAVGVQANGATAAALLDTTLLDSNAGGAVSAINGGRAVTYGTNRIVGSSGTGFTLNVPLQ
jgi:hypothetical protein